MIADSELTMAIDSTFNSIINEIQLSNLNFMINVTPYAAYITLKKSTLVDLNGAHALPSPPLLRVLQKSLEEKSAADDIIQNLKTDLMTCEKRCQELVNEKNTLYERLALVKNLMSENKAASAISDKKIERQEEEALKLKCEIKNLKLENSVLEKKNHDYACETGRELDSLKKSVKIKVKEIYNLNKKLNNLIDSNSNLKSELTSVKSSKSKLENSVRKLDQKVVRLESKKAQQSVSSQTQSTIDTPYSVHDPLPPIFGSTLSHNSKPLYLTNSLPDLSQISWVCTTEDDEIQERAEEALSAVYNRDALAFYAEALNKEYANNNRPIQEIG